MSAATTYRWSIYLAATAAMLTCAIALSQGIPAVTIIWRGVVSFAMVWAFQWSLLAAWEILGDELPTLESARVHQGGA